MVCRPEGGQSEEEALKETAVGTDREGKSAGGQVPAGSCGKNQSRRDAAN